MSEMLPIIRVRELKKEYKIRSDQLFGSKFTLHALSGVNLDIHKGETLGIIGESGCGKSTLGKCILQLEKVTSGQVFYEDSNLCHMSPKSLKTLRKDLQIIFQDPYSSLNPRMMAGQIIEEPLLIHGLEPDKKRRQAKIIEIMNEVGLDTQHIHRYPHEFSGGQRQRINIARALILDPKVIICDEPVSALDVSVQAQVLNLLSSLQKKRGLTYIFISHDLSVIKHISDRVTIMYLGLVVELCSSDRIYKNQMHPYTKALLSAIPPENPFERKEELLLEGEISSPIGEIKGCPLAKRCSSRMERCAKERPQLREVTGGHQVACFLYDN